MSIGLGLRSSRGDRINAMDPPWGIAEVVQGSIIMPLLSVIPIMTTISSPCGTALMSSGSRWVSFSEAIKLDRILVVI